MLHEWSDLSNNYTDLHLRGRGHSDIKSTTGTTNASTTNASTTNASTTSDVYSVCSFVGIGY